MKVTITADGIYSEFDGQFAGATERKRGEVVEFPDWYANWMIANKLAVKPVKAKAEIKVEARAEVEAEPVAPASKRPYVRKGKKPSAK